MRRWLRGRIEVQHLAACQAILTDRLGQCHHQLRPHGAVWVGGFIAEQLKRQREQGIPGQNRRRLVKFAVQCGPAATQVVIVHAGQVVMDQRLGMDAFDRRPDP